MVPILWLGKSSGKLGYKIKPVFSRCRSWMILNAKKKKRMHEFVLEAKKNLRWYAGLNNVLKYFVLHPFKFKLHLFLCFYVSILSTRVMRRSLQMHYSHKYMST